MTLDLSHSPEDQAVTPCASAVFKKTPTIADLPPFSLFGPVHNPELVEEVFIAMGYPEIHIGFDAKKDAKGEAPHRVTVPRSMHLKKKIRRRFFRTKKEAQEYKARRLYEHHHLGLRLATAYDENREVIEDALGFALRNDCLEDIDEIVKVGFESRRKRLESMPLGEFIHDRYLPHALLSNQPDSFHQVEAHAQHLVDGVGSTTLLEEITTEMIERTIDDYRYEKGGKLNPLSINSKRKWCQYFNPIFTFALLEGKISHNPMPQAPRMTLDRRLEQEQEKAVVLPRALHHLLNGLWMKGSKLIIIVALKAFAGLRNAEAYRLQWQYINFDKRVIEVTAFISKTRKRRRIQMHGSLVEILKQFREKSGFVVFPEKSVEIPKPSEYQQLDQVQRRELRKVFLEIRGQAVKNGDSAIKRMRRSLGLGDFPKNVLRNSFESYSVDLGIPEESVHKQAGHTQKTSQDYYFMHVDIGSGKEYFNWMPPACQFGKPFNGYQKTKFEGKPVLFEHERS